MARCILHIQVIFFLWTSLLLLSNAQNLDHQKKKILVATVVDGSHVRQMVQNIKELGLTGRYNISMLFPEGSHYDKGFEGFEFYPIYVKGYTQEHIDIIKEHILTNPNNDINSLIEVAIEMLKYTHSESDLIQYLKEQNYDMLLSEQVPHLYILQQLLGIEKHFVVMMDPYDQSMMDFNNLQLSHSAEYGMSTSMIFGTQPQDSIKNRFSFGQRLRNLVGMYIFNALTHFVWNPVKKSLMHPTDHHLISSVRSPDFLLAKGVEGLTTQIQLSPNQKCSYPFIKKQQKVEDNELTPALRQFIEKSEKIFLIAFGTTFLPSQDLLKTILSYILVNKDYHYVVSFKDKHVDSDLFQMIQDQDHIFFSNWVPQKQLLNNDKVKVFFTHGGYNSFLEVIESGTAAIGYPLAQSDQQRFCELFQELELGQCLAEISFENIDAALKKIESRNYYKENLDQMVKVIEKKREEEEDFIYWVDYVFKVDTSPLNPDQYSPMSLFKKIDLDIKLLIIVPLLLTRFALMALCKKYCCKKKSSEKKE